jgi:pilus assembly protein Flp/PilA
MLKSIKNVMINEDGATLVEYGLLIALVAAACIAVVTTFSGKIQAVFTKVGNAI